MFVVIKNGVYRHEVWGVFVSLEAAKTRGEEKLRAEPDNYHTALIIFIADGEEEILGEIKRSSSAATYEIAWEGV